MTKDEKSDSEYEMLLKGLQSIASEGFRDAKGNRHKEKQICCRYFNTGLALGFSTGVLVDFLGVSTPSILDLAGYSDEDSEAIMELIGLITDEEIAQARPLN
ncbi:MAG: hypothetical protein NC238_08780 [Dehalobacter sp.]|nr:hypothetical protein [Dehalobacter sp.]